MAGTFVWNIPGCDIAIEREEIYSVKVDLAESQQETRTLWSTASLPRYKYKFKITGRTNVGSPSEVQTILNHYRSNRGQWDSFSMTDPYDGATVTCRYLSAIKMKKITAQWWEMTIEVVSLY